PGVRAGELRDLEGDRAVEFGVVGEVDRPHPAAAQQPTDGVPAHPLRERFVGGRGVGLGPGGRGGVEGVAGEHRLAGGGGHIGRAVRVFRWAVWESNPLPIRYERTARPLSFRPASSSYRRPAGAPTTAPAPPVEARSLLLRLLAPLVLVEEREDLRQVLERHG